MLSRSQHGHKVEVHTVYIPWNKCGTYQNPFTYSVRINKTFYRIYAQYIITLHYSSVKEDISEFVAYGIHARLGIAVYVSGM